ncbi:helix-hairpin-helix domain-containing protein [Planococcus sp. FY231025]|uniref:helix-hairpin-helix domain-containing protein n=1 Tax=Planococcus sp. FY231025 TaxID=3455699 RepID=UPI003F8F97AF
MNGSKSNLPEGLGKPAERALAAAGYSQLEDLAQARKEDLLKLHGFGPKALRILDAALIEKGLAFDSDLPTPRKEQD